MEDVVVLSKSIVRPESYDDKSVRVKIHLTPWDLSFNIAYEYPQRGLLFPQPDPDIDFISQLKYSLSVALKIFYPFAGRLVKTENEDDDGTVSFYVDCDGSGAKFVHASAKSISVSDILQPVDGNVPEFLSYFYPMTGVRSCEGTMEPLLASQVTELKDGLFIGFSYNHMVADGSSFWKFLNTWSQICSNGFEFDQSKFPPLVLCGWFLDGIKYPIRIPSSETEIADRIAASSSSLQENIFRFTSSKIFELKAKANDEVSVEDGKISSLQAVTAHMWRSIVRNSDLNLGEVVHCNLVMDMRGRLNPPLKKECFGNVVGLTTATTTVAEILNNGLGWVALQINKAVGSKTNEKEFREFAENWVKKPKILSPVAMSSSNNSIFVTSSPRFNVYGNDFGWGKPIAIRAARGNFSNGLLGFYPGIDEGNIEIQTCLLSSIMEKLSTDAEFLENVCFA